MSQHLRMGFVGGGRVTHLLLEGLHRASSLPGRMIVYDPEQKALERLSDVVGDRMTRADTVKAVAEASDLVFLAVHPPVAADICGQVKSMLHTEATIVSLIPAITIQRLSQMLGGFNRIVRMIPNAPSAVGKGYNPVVYSHDLTADGRSSLASLFRRWGQSPEVPEEQLEIYAILTGMGPTYFWFQWLALEKLATEFGLSESESRRATAAMLDGAVEIMYYSHLSAERVLDLIPAYPLKKDEETIRGIFVERLGNLYRKLREAAG